jgi:hypothetical protein
MLPSIADARNQTKTGQEEPIPFVLGLGKPHSGEQIVPDDELMIEGRANMCSDQKDGKNPTQMMKHADGSNPAACYAGPHHNRKQVSVIRDQTTQPKDEEGQTIQSIVDKLTELVQKGTASISPDRAFGSDANNDSDDQYDKQKAPKDHMDIYGRAPALIFSKEPGAEHQHNCKPMQRNGNRIVTLWCIHELIAPFL